MSDIRIASRLQAKALAWLLPEGLVFRERAYPVEFGRLDKSETHSDRLLGVTQSTTVEGGVTEGCRAWVEKIVLRSGMPESLFLNVMTHELGHVWLVENGIRCKADWACEGFCELLAHRYVSRIPDPDYRFMTESIVKRQDAVYGRGFRAVSELASRLDFKDFIARVRLEKEIPY